jgi:hypothetical protein
VFKTRAPAALGPQYSTVPLVRPGVTLGVKQVLQTNTRRTGVEFGGSPGAGRWLGRASAPGGVLTRIGEGQRARRARDGVVDTGS